MSAECYGSEKDIYERDILKHLRDGSQEEIGYPFVCHLVDDFEHNGPNGTHVCLVYELMGEELASFGLWFEKKMIPYNVMRKFALQLICALDFAHICNVIHTGICSPEVIQVDELTFMFRP